MVERPVPELCQPVDGDRLEQLASLLVTERRCLPHPDNVLWSLYRSRREVLSDRHPGERELLDLCRDMNRPYGLHPM